MNDIVQILYNGVDAFYPHPTPFVGREAENVYFGERWAQRETITLNGQITGCTFPSLYQAYTDLNAKFKTSYQPLEIWQTQGGVSGRVFLKENVEIQSIDIPDNGWIGAMPYTVTLTCYPSGYFSGAYGVLDPVDTWDHQERGDATLETKHTISCRGINTSRGTSNALDNARLWAAGRAGLNTIVSPIFISGVSVPNFCLQSQTENIDRFNGVYTRTETYSNDLARTGYGVIRYTTDVESGNNLITVSLNGTCEGRGNNISGLRTAFNRLDKLAIANKAYQDLFGRSDLNPTPITQSFNEDPFDITIGFGYTYDNDNSPPILFDYTVDCDVGTNGLITASIRGIVKVRGGSLASKLAQASAYADTVNLYGLVLPFYTPFDISSISPLNPVPTTNGRTVNQSDGTIELNATFSNQTQESAALDQFNFTLEFRPTVIKVDSQPKLDGAGAYSVVSLGYGPRASFAMNGSAICHDGVSLTQGVAAVRAVAYGQFAQYGRFASATLDIDSVTTNDNKNLSFSFSWSFDGSQRIGPETLASLAV